VIEISTIVTTEANDSAELYDDRVPVILAVSQWIAGVRRGV
jgi:putative SOS response-associated peptidase YedK